MRGMDVYLFIIVKMKSVHPYCIAVLNTCLLEITENTGILQELLEELESLLGIQIRVSEHLLDLWSLNDVGVILRL